MDKRYTGEDFGSNKSGDRVAPAQVPKLAETHFPACMKSLQGALQVSMLVPDIWYFQALICYFFYHFCKIRRVNIRL